MRPSRLWILVVGSLVAGGCASGQAVPRPFPGAAAPPPAPRGAVADAPAAAPPAPVSNPAVAPDAQAPFLTLRPTPWIATALALRGVPYRNGGADPAGFDCSGLVRYVFARHGVQLPRDVQSQYRIGDAVERHEVQPGDLVFFETVSRGASHVGIALGNGEFVHAPSSTGVVRTERYTIEYWARRWVGARRVG